MVHRDDVAVTYAVSCVFEKYVKLLHLRIFYSSFLSLVPSTYFYLFNSEIIFSFFFEFLVIRTLKLVETPIFLPPPQSAFAIC